MIVAKIAISLLSLGGLGLAYYIHTHKKTEKPLVCPLEGSCETVVRSDYSKFLGIPVEILGILYYSFTAILYALSVAMPVLLPDFLSYTMVGVTVIAFLFSAYLTAVQAFILKHWCTWCLISASICTVIFILALYLTNTQMLDFLPKFLV